jgi:hypothetical protein
LKTRRQWGSAIVLILMALAVAVAGCGSTIDASFDESGGPLSLSEAETIAQEADLSPADGIDVAHAPDARVDVLVWLRGRGSAGERTATLLTEGFPERTAAVPVLVRIAEVDGVRSIIVVEAVGAASGPLTSRRLWVFEYASGRVVRSSTYR